MTASKSLKLISGIIAATGLLITASCLSKTPKEGKADAVSGATPSYSGGERGALPPKGNDYEVLGVRDGIKSWAIKYDDKVIRGGEFYSDSAVKSLNEWGIRTVISVAPGDKERALCKANGYSLVEIPFNKEKGPSPADLQRFLQTLNTMPGKFYVHCVGGTHRAGVLGVAYRVHVLKWPYEKALIEFGRLGGDLKADHVLLEAVKTFTP
jgi:hypothetical protein